jgi:hypothetical protein
MNPAEMKFAGDELRPQRVWASTGRASYGVRRVLWLAQLLPLFMALLIMLPCGSALAQLSSQQTPTGQLSNHPLRPDPSDLESGMNGDANDPVYQQRRVHQLNDARHKSIVSDADKLLKLVTELNSEISSTTPASLTPEQLRKVAVIEKLARNVKEQMRSPINGPPAFLDSAQPLGNSPYRR